MYQIAMVKLGNRLADRFDDGPRRLKADRVGLLQNLIQIAAVQQFQHQIRHARGNVRMMDLIEAGMNDTCRRLGAGNELRECWIILVSDFAEEELHRHVAPQELVASQPYFAHRASADPAD